MNKSKAMTTVPTDSRLLDVAIDHFGRYGLEGASTRAIAHDAATPMSSITYHFGGKAGLYLAAADHIAARIRHHIGPAMEKAAALCGEGGSPDQARAALHAILGGMIQVMLMEETDAMARFIVREQADPTPAFDRIYDGVMRSTLDRLGLLVEQLGEGRIDRAESRLRAIAMVGQVLVFRVARATVMTGMGWDRIGADEARAIARTVAAHCDAILDRVAQASPQPTGDQP
jgi:AcrR family transcriptional regulator